MRVYSKKELVEQARLLASHSFCQDPADIAFGLLDRLKAPEPMSSMDFSLKKRVIRRPDGTKTSWSLGLTPYLRPILEAHDNPEIFEIIAPKPGRSGGTVVAENHALSLLDEGRKDIMWYLAGPTELKSYADRVMAPLFEDHPWIAARIGTSPSDNKKTMKRLGSQTIELMVMSKTTTTNRQAAYIFFDEPDSYHKDFRSSFLENGRARQRMLGNDRKIYACAHPDVGWEGGIAGAWVLSTQGIYVMQCPECDGYGSPYPTKYWADVPRFRLHYDQLPPGSPIDKRLAAAEQSARILCPHCGSLLDEEQRAVMVDGAVDMHKGQTLDPEHGIIGEPNENRTWGFWIHALLTKQVSLAELARDLEGAREYKERTGKSNKLKWVLVRTFGEVFEGSGELTGLDAKVLKDRTREIVDTHGYLLGTVPPWVLYLTGAVDVAGGRFDILVRGWDEEGRSWLIDRRAIRQRKHADGIMRDIAPPKVQEDWMVLEEEIDRVYPLRDDPGKALPIAVMTIDASDGNVTWKAYEFARRMDHKRWVNWRRVRCIKGSTSKKAEPLPAKGTEISKDHENRPVLPKIMLYVLGVHKLKEETLEDLAISDGGPGQCYFAENTPEKAYEELFNEPLIDGEFHRNGPNETFDLYGYTKAGRLMLQPDRAGINWADPSKRPIWARPISLSTEQTDIEDDEQDVPRATAVEPVQQRNLLDRFSDLNKS